MHGIDSADMQSFSNDLLSEILEKRAQEAGEQENHAANKTSIVRTSSLTGAVVVFPVFI